MKTGADYLNRYKSYINNPNNMADLNPIKEYLDLPQTFSDQHILSDAELNNFFGQYIDPNFFRQRLSHSDQKNFLYSGSPNPKAFIRLPDMVMYGTFLEGSRDYVSADPNIIDSQVCNIGNAALAIIHPRLLTLGATDQQASAIKLYQYVTEDPDLNGWPQLIDGTIARQITGNQKIGAGIDARLKKFKDDLPKDTVRETIKNLYMEEFADNLGYKWTPIVVETEQSARQIAMCFTPDKAQPAIPDQITDHSSWLTYLQSNPNIRQ